MTLDFISKNKTQKTPATLKITSPYLKENDKKPNDMSPNSVQHLAVIGDPIEHSLSPPMQNAALRDLNLDWTYTKIRVVPQDLKKFLQTHKRRLRGFNVTLPHKENILPLLDYVVPQAQFIGAVNTVLNHQGSWIGFNTDGMGYIQSLHEETGFIAQKKNIVLLGAGGACRAISTLLATQGARRLTLLNRTLLRAQKLADSLKKKFPQTEFYALALNPKNLRTALPQADLLLNTSSIELHETAFLDFPWEQLPRKTLVSDILYRPRITAFLGAAQKHGHPIHTGEGMLVHQGALALTLWSGGLRPNIQLMHQTLLQCLEKPVSA